MPTKKKRVGFIPREDVMKIINKLSVENNLSNSKIISILVEEALSVRGIFNKQTGKASNSFLKNEDSSKVLNEDSDDFIENKKFKTNTKFGNNNDLAKTNIPLQKNNGSFNPNTYKRFLSFLKFQEMMDEYYN